MACSADSSSRSEDIRPCPSPTHAKRHYGEFGQLRETRGEVHVEWQIPDVFSLLGDSCKSPTFPLSDSCWYLEFFPYGSCYGWISLSLNRKDSGPSKTVNFHLSIKRDDCTTKEIHDCRLALDKTNPEYLIPKALERSKLSRQKSTLAPSDVLTVIAVLESVDPHSMEFSLFTRLLNVSLDLEEILTNRKRSDVLLKAGGKEMKAHRVILETRCPVFARMFCHEMVENRTGVIEISDIEANVLECILSYMYTGEVKGMTSQNMCKVYVVADKYDLSELLNLCTRFMEDNLSEEVICEVINIADMYEDTKLNEHAREYFSQNASKIVESDQWKLFKSEKNELAMAFLESIAVKHASKTK